MDVIRSARERYLMRYQATIAVSSVDSTSVEQRVATLVDIVGNGGQLTASSRLMFFALAASVWINTPASRLASPLASFQVGVMFTSPIGAIIVGMDGVRVIDRWSTAAASSTTATQPRILGHKSPLR